MILNNSHKDDISCNLMSTLFELDKLLTDPMVTSIRSAHRQHIIVFYQTLDWRDLKMLESTVSVLPSDWFSLSGWPEFQQTYYNCFVCVCVGGGGVRNFVVSI